MGGVRALGEKKAQQRQPHADEYDLAVSDFTGRRGDHYLCGGETRHLATPCTGNNFSCNYSGGEGSRVRGSGKNLLPGLDGRHPDSYKPGEVEDYGACPRESLNPEP
jgi:hypothetical protein